MGFNNDEGLLKVFEAAGARGMTAKAARTAFNKTTTGKGVSVATVYRFLGRHSGKFEKLKGRKFALRSFPFNVIPFQPKAKSMKTVDNLSKVQKLVYEGYKQFAGPSGITVEDLDHQLRKTDAETLGAIEKRRCNHASTLLKKLGLIEQCGTRSVPGSNGTMGVYKLSAPKPEPKEAAAAEVIPVTQAADAAQKRGPVLRKGEWEVECPHDATPEYVAELMNRLAAKTG